MGKAVFQSPDFRCLPDEIGVVPRSKTAIFAKLFRNPASPGTCETIVA
jgi:hypothetical protein